mgnify:FL=1
MLLPASSGSTTSKRARKELGEAKILKGNYLVVDSLTKKKTQIVGDLKIKQGDTILTRFLSEVVVSFDNIELTIHQLSIVSIETISYGDSFSYISIFLERGEVTAKVISKKNASLIIDTLYNSIFTKNGLFIVNCNGKLEVKAGVVGKTNESLRKTETYALPDGSFNKRISHILPSKITVITRDKALYVEEDIIYDEELR